MTYRVRDYSITPFMYKSMNGMLLCSYTIIPLDKPNCYMYHMLQRKERIEPKYNETKWFYCLCTFIIEASAISTFKQKLEVFILSWSLPILNIWWLSQSLSLSLPLSPSLSLSILLSLPLSPLLCLLLSLVYCYCRYNHRHYHYHYQWNFRWIIFKIILEIGGWDISYEIALTWISLYLTDDKSMLVQVMTWCPQAASHYLNKCRPRSMSTCGVPGPQWVNVFLFFYFHIVFLIISHHNTLS